MKNLCMIITLSLLLSLFSAKDLLRSNSRSYQDSNGTYTYGLGSNGGYILKDPKNYKTPELLMKLVPQQKVLQIPSPQVIADEKPSEFEFYDGSSKLNKLSISCKIFTNSNDCLSISNCGIFCLKIGWCDSRKCCISGNANGPLGPCDKASYIFSTPHRPTDRRAKALASGLNPLQLTVITK